MSLSTDVIKQYRYHCQCHEVLALSLSLLRCIVLTLCDDMYMSCMDVGVDAHPSAPTCTWYARTPTQTRVSFIRDVVAKVNNSASSGDNTRQEDPLISMLGGKQQA